ESILITLATPGGPTSFPVVLKKVMESPPPNILDGDDDTSKDKGGDGDDLGGSSDMGPSAALTPAIWDKTIPYDGENFHLEYMDLEEFLMENGIPSLPGEDARKVGPGGIDSEAEEAKSPQVTLLPSEDLDVCQKEVVTTASGDSDIICEVTTESDRATPEPVNPDEIEISVNYEPDPTDLMLSSVPGGQLFDPRKHRFSEEDLKPQPMIKKAKKVFVPEEQKDDKYWQRRKKNNLAAKRSRDARRLKENQITVRAAFLERENAALRTEVAELRKECGRYKNVVSRYESKYGQL
uniref:TEF transcription factor, PAR bZIP family member a n=1 Tax=Tetraodon nigroviridis TaxID=99883 RepID=H3D5Y0_TETNG